MDRIDADMLARMSWSARERREAFRRYQVQLAAIEHHDRYHGVKCLCPYRHRRANQRDA